MKKLLSWATSCMMMTSLLSFAPLAMAQDTGGTSGGGFNQGGPGGGYPGGGPGGGFLGGGPGGMMSMIGQMEGMDNFLRNIPNFNLARSLSRAAKKGKTPKACSGLLQSLAAADENAVEECEEAVGDAAVDAVKQNPQISAQDLGVLLDVVSTLRVAGVSTVTRMAVITAIKMSAFAAYQAEGMAAEGEEEMQTSFDRQRKYRKEDMAAREADEERRRTENRARREQSQTQGDQGDFRMMGMPGGGEHGGQGGFQFPGSKEQFQERGEGVSGGFPGRGFGSPGGRFGPGGEFPGKGEFRGQPGQFPGGPGGRFGGEHQGPFDSSYKTNMTDEQRKMMMEQGGPMGGGQMMSPPGGMPGMQPGGTPFPGGFMMQQPGMQPGIQPSMQPGEAGSMSPPPSGGGAPPPTGASVYNSYAGQGFVLGLFNWLTGR